MPEPNNQPPIQELKAAAIAAVDLKNPMVAYHGHFADRETEYSYAQFLRDVKHPNAPKDPNEPEVPAGPGETFQQLERELTEATATLQETEADTPEFDAQKAVVAELQEKLDAQKASLKR